MGLYTCCIISYLRLSWGGGGGFTAAGKKRKSLRARRDQECYIVLACALNEAVVCLTCSLTNWRSLSWYKCTVTVRGWSEVHIFLFTHVYIGCTHSTCTTCNKLGIISISYHVHFTMDSMRSQTWHDCIVYYICTAYLAFIHVHVTVPFKLVWHTYNVPCWYFWLRLLNSQRFWTYLIGCLLICVSILCP